MARKPIERRPFADADTSADAAPEARKPLPMRARPNWDDMEEGEPGPDRYALPTEKVEKLRRDYGLEPQWVTDSVRGAPVPQHRAAFEKKGWTPVHGDDFDGMFDGLYAPKGAAGEINEGGLVLCVRPIEISERARAKERRDALMPVQIQEARFKERALPGISASAQEHPTVRNSVRKEIERIEIPDEA